MNDKRNLTSGSIPLKLILYFLPIAAGTWFQQLYNAVDAVIVGKYVGTTALAAVGGSSAMLILFLIGFFVNLSGGAAVVFAQLKGAGRTQDLSRATGTAVAMCAAGGAAITVLCFAAAPLLLKLMKTPADCFEESVLYIRIYFSGTVFQLLANMESGILRATGDSRSPFYYMLFSCLTNIVLDFVFVLFLGLGVAGVAIATVLSQFVNAALTTAKLLRTDDACRLDPKMIGFDRRLLSMMLRLGVPAGLQASMYNVSNMVLQVGVNLLGTVTAASWALSGRIDGFYWATANAAGVAVTNFVGQNYGAGLYGRIKKSTRISMVLFMGVTLFFSAALILSGPTVLRWFTPDQAVRDTTYRIMLAFVPFYFLWAVVEVISGTLRGAGDAVRPVVITGIGTCLLRIVWMAVVFRSRPTLPVLCFCYPLSWTVTGAALVIRYFRGAWMRPEAETGREV